MIILDAESRTFRLSEVEAKSRCQLAESGIAVIIGAGPAGLTAAYELLTRTKIVPVILEKTDSLGGLAQTVKYKGNRMDIGGHRFFSKSDRVMDWWFQMMPLEATDLPAALITYQNSSRSLALESKGPDPDSQDRVMLLRKRKSRIYFLRRFFDYPISLTADTLSKLGVLRTAKIGLSFLKSSAFPIRPENNLEQFFINRFGTELYRTFFKSYTEKVWGVPCHKISAAWGAQRVKGLSITKTIKHAFKKIFGHKADIKQKTVETSLIEQFVYPKFGPGQMWETVAKEVEALGGQLFMNQSVVSLSVKDNRVVAVESLNTTSGERRSFACDYVFSTMPIVELIDALKAEIPPQIKQISQGLVYRDFITVGLLVKELKVKSPTGQPLISDNWIYIQEPDVLLGRLQIFNNWSPYMVADADKVWLGLEYFCNTDDAIWSYSDQQMIQLAEKELIQIGMIEPSVVLDGTVVRKEKTYPAYFGSYDRFEELRAYIDGFENLYLVGRNGMHKYNNQDHSMLTAMVAVDNIIAGRNDKDNIWQVNAEMEYEEEKRTQPN